MVTTPCEWMSPVSTIRIVIRVCTLLLVFHFSFSRFSRFRLLPVKENFLCRQVFKVSARKRLYLPAFPYFITHPVFVRWPTVSHAALWVDIKLAEKKRKRKQIQLYNYYGKDNQRRRNRRTIA